MSNNKRSIADSYWLRLYIVGAVMTTGLSSIIMIASNVALWTFGGFVLCVIAGVLWPILDIGLLLTAHFSGYGELLPTLGCVVLFIVFSACMASVWKPHGQLLFDHPYTGQDGS